MTSNGNLRLARWLCVMSFVVVGMTGCSREDGNERSAELNPPAEGGEPKTKDANQAGESKDSQDCIKVKGAVNELIAAESKGFFAKLDWIDSPSSKQDLSGVLSFADSKKCQISDADTLKIQLQMRCCGMRPDMSPLTIKETTSQDGVTKYTFDHLYIPSGGEWLLLVSLAKGTLLDTAQFELTVP